MAKTLLACVLILAPVGFPQIQLAPTVQFPCGSNNRALVAADLDLDGDQDVVVVNFGSVATLLNDGTGAFGPPSNHVTSAQSNRAIETADFDGDGSPDVVIAANSQNGSIPNDLVVLLNDGTGSFGAPQLLSTQDPIVALQAGDLDGDGDVDLIGSTGFNDEIKVFLNTGAGVLFAAQTITSLDAFDVRLADLDGNLDLDIVAAHDASVEVHVNNGFASFTSAGSVPAATIGGSGIRGLACGDIDGDGDPDVMASQYSVPGSPPGNSGEVIVLENVGGALSAILTVAVGDELGSIAFGDLNSDGNPDAAICDSGATDRLWALENGGAGAFVSNPAPHAVGTDPVGVVIADVNGDGGLDVITTNPPSQNISVLINLTPPVIPPPFPGSGSDLFLATGVNALPTGGFGQYVKPASEADAVAVLMSSPAGSFVFDPVLLLAEIFSPGASPTFSAAYPELHVSGNNTAFLIGSVGGFAPLLPPTGLSYAALVPTGVSGFDIMFQGVVVTPLATNGFFETTDGYVIQVQ